jgi:hypothetical protein
MSSLINLLASKDEEVTTGEIVQRKTDRIYDVQVGKRTLSVQSLVTEDLPKNSRVVLVKTTNGFFITNIERVKDRRTIGVVIDG